MVLEAECGHLLQNTWHEARVQAIRDYYASTNIKRSKTKCRGKFLSKEKHMKVITYSQGLELSFLDLICRRSAEISLDSLRCPRDGVWIRWTAGRRWWMRGALPNG